MSYLGKLYRKTASLNSYCAFISGHYVFHVQEADYLPSKPRQTMTREFGARESRDLRNPVTTDA